MFLPPRRGEIDAPARLPSVLRSDAVPRYLPHTPSMSQLQRYWGVPCAAYEGDFRAETVWSGIFPAGLITDATQGRMGLEPYHTGEREDKLDKFHLSFNSKYLK